MVAYFRRYNPLNYSSGNQLPAGQVNALDDGLEDVSIALEALEVAHASTSSGVSAEVAARIAAITKVQCGALGDWRSAPLINGVSDLYAFHYSPKYRKLFLRSATNNQLYTTLQDFWIANASGTINVDVTGSVAENSSGIIIAGYSASSSNKFGRTANGTTWTHGASTSLTTGFNFTVGLNASDFLLVSSGARSVATSPDGSTWTDRSNVLSPLASFATPYAARGIGHQGGYLVLSGSNKFAISLNGGVSFTEYNVSAGITYYTTSNAWWDSTRNCWWLGATNSTKARLIRIALDGTQTIVTPLVAGVEIDGEARIQGIVNGILLFSVMSGLLTTFVSPDGATSYPTGGPYITTSPVNCGNHFRMVAGTVSLASGLVN